MTTKTAYRNAMRAVVKAAGSKSAIARHMNVSRQAVLYWERRGIPADRCAEIERLTGVPRADLRPDVFA